MQLENPKLNTNPKRQTPFRWKNQNGKTSSILCCFQQKTTNNRKHTKNRTPSRLNKEKMQDPKRWLNKPPQVAPKAYTLNLHLSGKHDQQTQQNPALTKRPGFVRGGVPPPRGKQSCNHSRGRGHNGPDHPPSLRFNPCRRRLPAGDG